MSTEKLQALEWRQLVAIARQKTGESYQSILAMNKDALVKLLATIDNVLEPERA
jgi:hypothetical protein